MDKKNKLLKCDVSYSKCESYIYSNNQFFWTPNQYQKSPLDYKSIRIARHVAEQNDWDFERFYKQGETDESYSPWRAEFFMDGYLKGKSLKVKHSEIDFDWSNEAPFKGFTRYAFSAQWQTCLTLEKQAKLFVELLADEGSRFYVNENRVIDAWTGQAGVEQNTTVNLTPGTHHIRLDYRARYWRSRVKLSLYLENKNGKSLVEPEQLSLLDSKTESCQ